MEKTKINLLRLDQKDRVNALESATLIKIGTSVNGQVDNVLDAGNAQGKIEKAKDFFKGLGIPIGNDGFLDENLSDEQLKVLSRWRDDTMGEGGIEMANERLFFYKTYLAVSLWKQKTPEGGIHYLLGKRGWR